MALALIRLRICTGLSESLLVAHTTLLEISCHRSHGSAQTVHTQIAPSVAVDSWVKVKLKISKILNFRNSNLKTCCKPTKC